jgi:hypothetical protein
MLSAAVPDAALPPPSLESCIHAVVAQLNERTLDLDIDVDGRSLRSTLESIATPCSVKA